MVLDGAVDHDLSEITMLVDEATAYETEFNRFIDWCAADTGCSLHGQNVVALWDRLIAEAVAEPLPAVACAKGAAPQPCQPTVRAEDLRLNAQGMLIAKPALPALGVAGWNELADALVKAAAGDASLLSTPLATGPTDNAFASGPAIACLDFPAESQDYDDLAAREQLGRVVAPRMQGASQTWTIITGCLGWPAPLTNPPHPAEVHGTPPILIVNSTHDPSTSYPWAVGLLTQIEGSALLTREGDGHISYMIPGDTRDAIDHYLLTGETPPPNTVLPD